MKMSAADLTGDARDAPPPGPKFFQFHAVFGKIWQNRMLVPPDELAPPPRGNPGSATECDPSSHRGRLNPTSVSFKTVHVIYCKKGDFVMYSTNNKNLSTLL